MRVGPCAFFLLQLGPIATTARKSSSTGCSAEALSLFLNKKKQYGVSLMARAGIERGALGGWGAPVVGEQHFKYTSTDRGGDFAATLDSRKGFDQARQREGDFATTDSRKGFVRKVYSIFMAQLITTVVISATIANDNAVKYWLFSHFHVVAPTASLLSTLAALLLVSFQSLRQTAPVNFILLALHVIMQSVTVGAFSSLANPRTVCLGTMHTLTALASLTLFSFITQHDLTTAGSALMALSSTAVVGIVLNSIFHMPLVDNLISGGLAVLFAAYLAHDTQMIVGGANRKRQYGQKDYILAALNLYQDVIALFTQIMKILIWLDKKQKKRFQRHD